jgi:hypothetical protein
MEVLRDVRDFIALRNNLVRSIIRYEISDTGTLQLAAIRHVRQGLEKNPKKRSFRPDPNGDIDSGTGSISNKSADAS